MNIIKSTFVLVSTGHSASRSACWRSSASSTGRDRSPSPGGRPPVRIRTLRPSTSFKSAPILQPLPLPVRASFVRELGPLPPPRRSRASRRTQCTRVMATNQYGIAMSAPTAASTSKESPLQVQVFVGCEREFTLCHSMLAVASLFERRNHRLLALREPSLLSELLLTVHISTI